MPVGGYRDINFLPSELLGRRITELSCYHAILQKLGVHLYTDIRGEEGNWERLAEELGVSTYNEIENIHRHASLEKIFPGSVLLKRWGDHAGSTVYVLLKALKKLGREDCVEDVCCFLEDENNMELHVSVEDETSINKEFITVKTKKDATLGSSLENALGSLVCYQIVGPDSTLTWNTLAFHLKGKQLSLKKVPFDDDRRHSIYGSTSDNCQYPFTLESSYNFNTPAVPQYPANIPIDGSTTATFKTYGPENNLHFRSNSPKPFEASLCSQTIRKEVDSGSNSSLTQVKLYDDDEQHSQELRRVLKHSKSIEETNFKGLASVKKCEKEIVKDFDYNSLKKCNSMSDIHCDPEPLKKFDSVTSMDTSDNFVKCNFNCGAEKCTHSLIWENGQMKFANYHSDSLDVSQESLMDTRDVLEICTLPNTCSTDDNNYVPHIFVLPRRSSSELSSPVSPINSPPKGHDLPTSNSIAAAAASTPAQKPGENESLLRTALRRSFEKKTEKAEMPTPKPCKKAQPQQNELYLASESDYIPEDTSVSNIEKELSKRPAQCRLPVADGYIPMDAPNSNSDGRPTSLPLDSSSVYMNMSGTSQHLARRPLPPRPREGKSYPGRNPLIHSHSVGDSIVLTPDNEYCYISDEDQSSAASSPILPLKKRTVTQPIPIHRSQSSSAIPDLSNVPGWCASISEGNVSSTMNRYKNEDGNFMVWRMKDNTYVITVSHLRDLRHYAIHCRNINDQLNYYIFNGGFMTTSISELVHHYQSEGLKGPDPMLDGGRGKKWQKFSHVKLKHPMKSRSSPRKNSD